MIQVSERLSASSACYRINSLQPPNPQLSQGVSVTVGLTQHCSAVGVRSNVTIPKSQTKKELFFPFPFSLHNSRFEGWCHWLASWRRRKSFCPCFLAYITIDLKDDGIVQRQDEEKKSSPSPPPFLPSLHNSRFEGWCHCAASWRTKSDNHQYGTTLLCALLDHGQSAFSAQLI